MGEKIIKNGIEILDEFFKKLSVDEEIDHDLRMALLDLWEQRRLYTKTYLFRTLDELRRKKSK